MLRRCLSTSTVKCCFAAAIVLSTNVFVVKYLMDSKPSSFIEDQHRDIKYSVGRLLKEKAASTSGFVIADYFRFPQPKYCHSEKTILHAKWVSNLQAILSSIEGNQLSLVTSSKEHTSVLLNWLIAAHLIPATPLHNIVVLSLDIGLHHFLIQHGIKCLFVHPSQIMRNSHIQVFSQVHLVRLAVLRLINHYGYDVVNYDCDAIPLKNLGPVFDIYEDADIVGTFGKGPLTLYEKWGVTLNTGVMLLRSNSRTEYFWQTMSSLSRQVTDDQNSVNFAFEKLGIKWRDVYATSLIEDIHDTVYGYGTHLKVALLSFDLVCRQTCTISKREDYYVWHAMAIGVNRTVERKQSQAAVGQAWFLNPNWEDLSRGNVRGKEWLQKIAS